MVTKIGDAVPFNNPENFQMLPDDRQQKIEVMGGVVVQDYGHIEAGDSFSFSAIFDSTNAALIFSYWDTRTLVTYINETGSSYANCRVVVKSFSYINRHAKFYKINLEIWRV